MNSGGSCSLIIYLVGIEGWIQRAWWFRQVKQSGAFLVWLIVEHHSPGAIALRIESFSLPAALDRKRKCLEVFPPPGPDNSHGRFSCPAPYDLRNRVLGGSSAWPSARSATRARRQAWIVFSFRSSRCIVRLSPRSQGSLGLPIRRKSRRHLLARNFLRSPGARPRHGDLGVNTSRNQHIHMHA
jgi:hypothetical protein